MRAPALCSHQAVFAADAISPARTRAFVTAHLVEHAMAPSLIADVDLVGSELGLEDHREWAAVVEVFNTRWGVTTAVDDGEISVWAVFDAP